MKTKKNDLILLGLVLLVGIGLAIVFFLIPDGGYVKVTIDGQLYSNYSLAEERTVKIESPDGGVNILHISEGKAWLSDCSCPDRTCEHMGKISKKGQSIICLPNKVIVSIEGKHSEDEIDVYQGGAYAK